MSNEKIIPIADLKDAEWRISQLFSKIEALEQDRLIYRAEINKKYDKLKTEIAELKQKVEMVDNRIQIFIEEEE